MSETTTGTLRVPGARLHYEVRGTGPVLLLIPGGGGDAGVFEPLSAGLTDRCTVVTYDPRGYSRSPLDGPARDQRVEEQSDDARRLLDHLSDGPASVFGSSSGAVVAMDLLVRHPERLRRVVAHEPPLFGVLPDAARHRAMVEGVYGTYRAEGAHAGMAAFGRAVGMGDFEMPSPGELPPPFAALIERLVSNQPYFLEHELRQFTSFLPDVPALRDRSAKLVLAGGRDGRDNLPYRPATELAAQLATEVVDFPGGHSGYTDQPAEFAALLCEVLG
ncbi:alpha/beta fold hydrolase [Streptomyces griseocarneus]|uniref:alpha/beta fold hydrolase n=1 Tax=Streptomyces griseocarneus TaxID=51201 RepID=UPI00167D9EC9|nr:alpha/beta hydrolase [Streptomyces griseocarneus]MBZ6473816.1 alpha/beta hydrolase [Streptomyces griseocarneus]GHG65299.1 alpha/beta hydrolase [Streptomyces griseocarneus]